MSDSDRTLTEHYCCTTDWYKDRVKLLIYRYTTKGIEDYVLVERIEQDGRITAYYRQMADKVLSCSQCKHRITCLLNPTAARVFESK